MSRALVGVFVADPPEFSRVAVAAMLATRSAATKPPSSSRPVPAVGRAACAGRCDGRDAIFLVCRSRRGRGGETGQQGRQPRPRPGAPALDRPLRYVEQPGGVGHRVAVHVDGQDRSALLCGQAHQCLAHHDRRLDVCRPIGHRTVILDEFRNGRTVAPQPVQAGIDDNPVQPTADCRVVTERAGRSVRGEQGLLQGVVGILGGLATPPRKPMQLRAMAPNQLLKRTAVTGDVSGKQSGVAAIVGFQAGHGRTLASVAVRGTSPCPTGRFQEAARTVISETSVRLCPAVWPIVEIHTSRCDVGPALGTEMVLVPGLRAVGPVSRMVS